MPSTCGGFLMKLKYHKKKNESIITPEFKSRLLAFDS